MGPPLVGKTDRVDKREERGDMNEMNEVRDGRREVAGSAYQYYYLILVRTMHGDFY
ncbi:uncharacterized protein TrAFT101_005525 [Trichoderma asperellum]|uniref:uncharacterized protein n=1 Tax=Trichoderma asperellum TaxID=101201 RepID=UPI0033181900|nr:hypothetical protein TrAFT101_005525 [Trichoderma asperellum]